MNINKLFIFGAGFSKAFNSTMPLLNDLFDFIIEEKIDIPSEYLGNMNLEDILSILVMDAPWKTKYEKNRDLACYHNIINKLKEYIEFCEDKSFNKETPKWIIDFVLYLHNNKIPIVTFNYDTIIERILLLLSDLKIIKEKINLYNIYKGPIFDLGNRYNFTWGIEDQSTLQLLKIHGSINWRIHTESNIGNAYFFNIYNVENNYSSIKRIDRYASTDLESLLIPPVYNKESYFNYGIITSLWNDFRNYLKKAKEIYFLGYSLPKSDSYIRNFYKFYTKSSAKIIIVNTDSNKEKIISNYAEVFNKKYLVNDYIGSPNPIEQLALNLNSEITS